jgi:hypothetical protein
MVGKSLIDGPQDLTSIGIDDLFLVAIVLSIDNSKQFTPQAGLAMQVVASDCLVDWLLESWAFLLQASL